MRLAARADSHRHRNWRRAPGSIQPFAAAPSRSVGRPSPRLGLSTHSLCARRADSALVVLPVIAGVALAVTAVIISRISIAVSGVLAEIDPRQHDPGQVAAVGLE